MPEKNIQIKELEQKVAKLETDLAKERKTRQRLQQAERLYTVQRQRMIKLLKEAHFFRATVGMPELYLDEDWRIIGYSGNFMHLTESVAEFARRKKHIRSFLCPGDFKKIEDYLQLVEALRNLPYGKGQRWRLKYKGPNPAERLGKEWIPFRTSDKGRWKIARDKGTVKIIHQQHIEDKQDCYLIAADEYGGPEEDIKVSYKIKTSKNKDHIKDLSLIISAGSGHEETFPDLLGYSVCTGSYDNTSASVQRQGADLVTMDESLEPDTEYQVTVERTGGRISRKLKNLRTGKQAPELELIDSDAIFDLQNHIGFHTFSGKAEFYDVKIYSRNSRFNIDQFKIPCDLEVGIRAKSLQGRFFRLRLGVLESDGRLFNSLLFEDITEGKRAEEALLKAGEELEQKVSERTAELAIINEELKLETLQRKRAAEALREGEKKYKTLAEQTKDIVYSVNTRGVLTYISPQVERYGYAPEEMIGHAVQEFIYPEDIEPALTDFQRTAETGEEFPTQFRIADKQGGIHWFEEYGKVIRDKKGNFSGLTGALRDIGQRKKVEEELQKHRDHLEDLVKERTVELTRANQQLEKEILVREETEKALRESEESYRTVVETMKEGLAVVDEILKLTFVNDALCRITGFTREELLRSDALLFLDEKQQNIVKNRFKKRKKGETNSYELLLQGKNKRRIHILVSPQPLFDEKRRFKGTVAVITDITERKRAEEALRESEEWFRYVFDGSRDAIFITAADASFVDMNESASLLTGYSREELKKMSIPGLHEKEDLQAYKTFFKRIMAGEEIVSEAMIRRKDGTKLATEFSNKRISIRGVLYMHSTARDITERKQMELALRYSEERYRMLFELSPEAIALIDAKGMILDCNQVAADLGKRTKEEIIGRPFWELGALTKKDIPKYIKLLPQVVAGKKLEGLEVRTITKEGEERWIEIFASLLHKGKKIFAIQIICRDITERKQAEGALRESELKFRELAESINDVFYALDKNLKYTFWNKASEKLTGVPAQKAIGKSVYDLFPDAKGGSAERLYLDALKKKRTGSLEVEYKRPGINYTLDLSVYPSQEGLSVFGKDITARKRAEAALRESEERFRTIFHSTAVAIWEEDFSGVKAEIEKLRARGVRDFRKYLDEHPEFVGKVAAQIKVIDVNDTALKLYGAKNKEELIASVDKVFVAETMPAFKEVVIGLAQGDEEIETETVNGTLDGRCLNVLKRTYIPTGRSKFGNLLVSVVDISDLKQAESALRRRAEFEFLITTISTRFINLRPEETDQGIEQALKTIGEFAGVDRSYLFLTSEDGTKVSNTHEWCADGIDPQIERLKDLPVEAFSWWADRFLIKREAVHIPNVEDLPSEAQAEKEMLQSQSIKSLLALPIIFRESVVGFLGFDSVKTKKTWEDEDVVLLRMVGEIFINALERKRMEEELRKERDSLEVRVAQSTDALRRSELKLQERLRELTCFYKIRDEFDREQPLEDTLYACASHIRNALNEPEKKIVLINLDGFQIIIENCKYDRENCLEGLIQIGGIKRGVLRVFRGIGESGFLPFEWDLVRNAGASLASLIQNRELHTHLIQSEKMAAAGRLAAGVAHEINNPLGSIKNSLFILKKSFPAKHQDRSYLDLMDGEIDRVSGIIAQLYNLYKPSAREVQQVNLAVVVGNVLKMLEPQIRRRKITVQNEMAINSAKLKLSVDQVTQVLYNIILNAVQVMPLGGRLTIGCTKSTGRLELWISDTGPGIPDEVLPHIFEPFFTTKSKGAHSTGGMGMGLPLSRSLMETLGGTILVKTKIGWGSSFILNFPTKLLKREKDEKK